MKKIILSLVAILMVSGVSVSFAQSKKKNNAKQSGKETAATVQNVANAVAPTYKEATLAKKADKKSTIKVANSSTSNKEAKKISAPKSKEAKAAK